MVRIDGGLSMEIWELCFGNSEKFLEVRFFHIEVLQESHQA